MKRPAIIVVWTLVAFLPLGCRQGGEMATQTSEVVVLDDAAPADPFDKEFLVDGERASRIVTGMAPPRLVSRGPRVRFPSSDRNVCFPAATIIVVVDKSGAVRETEIVSVAPAVEYVDGQRRQLTAEESFALIKEREFAIRNWTYEPAMKDGAPVPVLVDGGWRMNCR
jgi:hypothetical protein